ncbi:MAG TPA: M56 family metallopeptidase [Candidatus Sulfotelmatobacter sp.]|nr:M56 family metallopeptidase [Candidatus Sulfotelmatobacter sp.]
MTTAIMNWLSPNALHATGWALVHFLWQGTALAALAAVAMALCRRTSARYVVAVCALGLMSLAPLATFVFYYAQQNAGLSYSAPASPSAAVGWPIVMGHIVAPGPVPQVSLAPSRDEIVWLVEAWLAGVALFSLRSAGGFLLLERKRRKQSSIVNARMLNLCYDLQDRLGIHRAIEYCECKWLQAPAVIGWFRPIVFLPVNALTGLSEDQLQAIIAHELAHIRRYDPFVNVFQVCVESLLFYHPAIWWLNKRIRAEREHCCDEIAVTVCGNAVEYARALTLMEEWRSAPVLVMAANRGPLTERIIRVLGIKTLSAGMRSVGLTGGLLCLAAALLSGNALLDLARPASARAAARMQVATRAESPRPPASKTKPSASQAATSEQTETSTKTATATAASTTTATSYIDGMKSVGLTDLSVDTLIALKVQDVTPEYVRGLQEQGLHPDAEKLIGMRVQGVSPEYVRDLRAAGLNPSADQLIGLKVQGVDAEYYRGLKQAGIDPDIDRLIGLQVQGVTPEYVSQLRAAGLALTADQVIAMKVQDVTPEYLKAMREQGIDVNADSLIAMKVQDVTPEYVRQIKALGLKPSANELISLRVQDVTPEYVKALQSAGFALSISDIISAKVQDVTPEFIARARQHGFKDLSLQKLIRLRQLGILDSKADL